MTWRAPQRKSRLNLVKVFAGLLGVGGFLATVVLVARPSLARDNRDGISTVAAPLLAAARSWRAANPEGCPTVGGLIHEGALPEDIERGDPWGGTFRLVCSDDGEFSLLSPGRDGQLGTADDLEYPRR